jgi:putative transposase
LDRQQVFFGPGDYEIYLALVRSSAVRFGSDLLGYCLMPNHVHWIAVPKYAESLARTFGDAHGRYAAYANAKLSRSGHFWQNRFFSCPLDHAHLFAALRYIERNPVRARLTEQASAFRWSSAAVHAGIGTLPEWLAPEPLQSTFTAEQWEMYLQSDTIGEAEFQLRINTYTGRPSGNSEFVKRAEDSLGRRLAPLPGGRPSGKSLATAAADSGMQTVLLNEE